MEPYLLKGIPGVDVGSSWNLSMYSKVSSEGSTVVIRWSRSTLVNFTPLLEEEEDSWGGWNSAVSSGISPFGYSRLPVVVSEEHGC